MRNFLATCLLLLLAACGAQQPPASAAMQGPPEFVCTPGEHVPDPNVLKDTVRISYFVVTQSLAVLPYVDNGTIVGDYAIPLFKAARQGRVEFSHRRGNLRVAIHYPGAMPRYVALVGTGNRCVGMMPIVQVAPAIYAVDIPITEFAALVFYRQALNTQNHRAWACAQTDFPVVYVPTLTDGPYKGKPRMLCGLGGVEPGTTVLGAVSVEGSGTLTPFIAQNGG